MKEHLARFHMGKGKTIDMHRADGDVTIANVTLPRATGQQTLDMIALLDDLSEKVEYPEPEEAP